MNVPKRFYYSHGQEVVGPLTGIELRQLAVAGQVTPQTFVCVGEEGDWVEAARIKGLFNEAGQPIAPEVVDAVPAQPLPQAQPTAAASQKTSEFTSVSTSGTSTPRASEPIPQVTASSDPIPNSALNHLARMKPLPPGSWLEPMALAIAKPFGTRGNRAAIWQFAIRAFALAALTYPLSFVLVITSYSQWSTSLESSPGRKLVLTVVLTQVAALLVLALGHYVIQKMVEPNEELLERPFKVTTLKPYHCLGVVLVVGGILFVLMGIWQGLLTNDYRLLMIQWLIGIGCYSASTYLFNPNRLYIQVSETASTSDNALAFIAFWIKLPILILPAAIAVAACISIALNVVGPVVQLGLYFELLTPSAGKVALATSPYALPWVLGMLGLTPMLSFFIGSLATVFVDVIKSIYEIAVNSRRSSQ